MRRLPTGILVAAVAVLGVAAAVDAFRDGAEPSRGAPAEAAVAPERTAAADALRTAGATGTLVYSDAGCRLHALRLPGLRPAPASRIQRCEPHVPTGGIGTFEGDVVWAGLGAGVVQVVRSKEELSRALRRSTGLEGPYRAVQAVPLGGDRIAALLTDSEGLDRIFAVFEDERVLIAFARWQLGDAGLLRPSPRGTYVALIERENDAVRVFTRDGDPVVLPAGVTNPYAIAWSPDERWTALATRASVYVFATEDPDGRLIRIPVSVRDLDWEADETIGAAAALREAGLRGVLTYSDEDCRLHALTLPDLAGHPASSERRCRLTGVVRLRFGRPVGDPQRILVARCRSGRVEVSELGGRLLGRAPGCFPAWRPDGTLTAVRNGELVSLFPARVVLSRDDLARELEGDFEIVEATWLSQTTLAAVVRATRPGSAPTVLAVFRGRRLVERPVAFGTRMSGLRVSPNGDFVAARSLRGAIVLDREGRRVPVPAGVGALSWSPDGAWAVGTRGDEIVFFRSGEPSAGGIPVPLAARDLVWR
ncbi:MAG: hypothetical protein ACRDNE_03500 [Gaiellaceae bacterium]